MSANGHKLDGTPITHAMVHDWVDEAEKGYSPEQLRPRTPGRHVTGSAAGSVESVRLNPPRAQT